MRIAFSIMWLLSVCSGPFAQHAEIKTAKEQIWDQGVIVRRLIIPPPAFNAVTLQKLFESVLVSESPKNRIIKIEAFPDSEAEAGTFKDVIDGTYEIWRRLYDSASRNIRASAQLISVRGNALMRIRDEKGNVSATVISGADPSIMKVSGVEFQLADLVPVTELIGREGRPELVINLFYWTRARYEESTGKQLFGQSAASLGVGRVRVVVERWPLFVFETQFPLIYPFMQMQGVPSKKEYLNSYRIWCFTTEGGIPMRGSFGEVPR